MCHPKDIAAAELSPLRAKIVALRMTPTTTSFGYFSYFSIQPKNRANTLFNDAKTRLFPGASQRLVAGIPAKSSCCNLSSIDMAFCPL